SSGVIGIRKVEMPNTRKACVGRKVRVVLIVTTGRRSHESKGCPVVISRHHCGECQILYSEWRAYILARVPDDLMIRLIQMTDGHRWRAITVGIAVVNRPVRTDAD